MTNPVITQGPTVERISSPIGTSPFDAGLVGRDVALSLWVKRIAGKSGNPCQAKSVQPQFTPVIPNQGDFTAGGGVLPNVDCCTPASAFSDCFHGYTDLAPGPWEPDGFADPLAKFDGTQMILDATLGACGASVYPDTPPPILGMSWDFELQFGAVIPDALATLIRAQNSFTQVVLVFMLPGSIEIDLTVADGMIVPFTAVLPDLTNKTVRFQIRVLPNQTVILLLNGVPLPLVMGSQQPQVSSPGNEVSFFFFASDPNGTVKVKSVAVHGQVVPFDVSFCCPVSQGGLAQ